MCSCICVQVQDSTAHVRGPFTGPCMVVFVGSLAHPDDLVALIAVLYHFFVPAVLTCCFEFCSVPFYAILFYSMLHFCKYIRLAFVLKA